MPRDFKNHWLRKPFAQSVKNQERINYLFEIRCLRHRVAQRAPFYRSSHLCNNCALARVKIVISTNPQKPFTLKISRRLKNPLIKSFVRGFPQSAGISSKRIFSDLLLKIYPDDSPNPDTKNSYEKIP